MQLILRLNILSLIIRLNIYIYEQRTSPPEY